MQSSMRHGLGPQLVTQFHILSLGSGTCPALGMYHRRSLHHLLYHHRLHQRLRRNLTGS
jgi:hypothetical protein